MFQFLCFIQQQGVELSFGYCYPQGQYEPSPCANSSFFQMVSESNITFGTFIIQYGYCYSYFDCANETILDYTLQYIYDVAKQNNFPITNVEVENLINYTDNGTYLAQQAYEVIQYIGLSNTEINVWLNAQLVCTQVYYTTICSCTVTQQVIQQFLDEMTTYNFGGLGIFTDPASWSSCFSNTNSFDNFMLFYQNQDNQLSFNDYQEFGGWQIPYMKQFGKADFPGFGGNSANLDFL